MKSAALEHPGPRSHEDTQQEPELERPGTIKAANSRREPPRTGASGGRAEARDWSIRGSESQGRHKGEGRAATARTGQGRADKREVVQGNQEQKHLKEGPSAGGR